MDFLLYESKNNSKRKSHKRKIDLLNVVYDEEFVSLLNSLSSYIKNLYTISLNIIKELNNNFLIIENHSIYSKCLINEINHNTKEKIMQLNDRIDAIGITKKVIGNEILLIESNLSKFYNDSKKIFKSLKKIRNSKINYAIDTSVNYEGNNSMSNFKTSFEKEDLILNENDRDNYYKNINNSICYDKEKSSSYTKRNLSNRMFPISRRNSQINKRYNLKLNYRYTDFNKKTYNASVKNNTKNNSLKLRNKLLNKKLNSSENILPSTFKKTLINNNYKNSNISPTKNNNSTYNLELSYKVIEFLSLLSNISKKNSNNNPYIHKTIQQFEEAKKNLFELSKKFIEQSNKKDINNKITQNYDNQNNQRNKSRKDLQLILMNNNITNIRKEIEYKELIEKINFLSKNNNNLEKDKKQLIIMNNHYKKELNNNNILLAKKKNQLISLKKEREELISQISFLQNDNESLMELIHNNIDNNKNNENELIIEEKEKIIKELKSQINELKNNHKIKEMKNYYENKINEKNNEMTNMNSKLEELKNNFKKLNNNLKQKEIFITEITSKKSNKFDDIQLNYEKIEELSYIGNKITKYKESNCTNIKKRFSFNELIFEQMEAFSYSIKTDRKIQKNNLDIDEEKDLEKLKKEIKELNDTLNEKEIEIQKYKNENSIMKNFFENNKKKEEEINEKNDYMEKINNLEMKIKEITEEKSKIKSDFDKAFLDNKKLEINVVSKDEEILKLKDNIKYLEEQIKEKHKKIINNNDAIIEEINSNSTKKIKTKINNNVDIYTHNQMISQLKDDIKEKENENEYLKIEIQELKSKIEEYEDNFNNSSFKQNNELNEKANIFEEKIKFLTERNEYYQKLLNENKIKIQNLENSNKTLNKEKEELKKNNQLGLNNFISDGLKNKNYEKNNKEKNEYHPDNYIILSDKSYGNLKWYLLTEKKNINNKSDESLKFTYDYLLWVPKIDLEEINRFEEYHNNEEDKFTRKLNKNEIIKDKDKEISFSSNVNNFSFHNNSEDFIKNKNNINNIEQNSKRGSFFSLGNNYLNEENNDINKLLEKLKTTLEQLNKAQEKYMNLKRRHKELKEKIRKNNKMNNNSRISLSDDSNDIFNGNEMGKSLSLENNLEGENNGLNKLNYNKNIIEQEYYESILIELDATKNQLNVIKKILKELEKKFESIKHICENLFSKINLKKAEKEEFKKLLKIMDFTDEKISIIIDKKK